MPRDISVTPVQLPKMPVDGDLHCLPEYYIHIKYQLSLMVRVKAAYSVTMNIFRKFLFSF